MGDFVNTENGRLRQKNATATSTGVAQANTIIKTGADGFIDSSLIPASDVKQIEAFENIGAGAFVNIFDDAGTFKARLADATDNSRPANAFALQAITAGNTGQVNFEGVNSQLSGLTTGPIYLSAATPGAVTQTAPSTAGNIVQPLGFACAATEANIEIGQDVELCP